MPDKISCKRTTIQPVRLRGWFPLGRDRQSGGQNQHGRIFRPSMPSPLNCSRVIFTMRASNSALERFSQTLFRRRVRSFCTQSSLLSGLVPLASSEFSALHARALNNFSGNDILPHMAAEASPERRGRRWERRCLALLGPDSMNFTEQGCSQLRVVGAISSAGGIANRTPTN